MMICILLTFLLGNWKMTSTTIIMTMMTTATEEENDDDTRRKVVHVWSPFHTHGCGRCMDRMHCLMHRIEQLFPPEQKGKGSIPGNRTAEMVGLFAYTISFILQSILAE